MLPERNAEVLEWVQDAALDLHAAERLLADDLSLAKPALFHCQQAAEKALKAYLVWRDHPFPKTHDLVRLMNLCASHEPQFATLADASRVLTSYAVVLRYPPYVATPTAEQSAEALRLARQVLSLVLDRLPLEVRP